MKRTKFRGHQALGAVAAVCLIGAARLQAAPDGVWVQTLGYDPGAVASGTRIDRSFRVVNLSWQPILVSTSATCGCTTAELTEDRLPPFSSLMVQAHVDAARKRTGAHQENLTLFFRSGRKNWETQAHIRYQVR